MNNNLRKYGALGAAFGTAFVLAACSTGPTAGSASGPVPTLAPDEKVEIVFESYNLATSGATADAVLGLIADFEAENPNITVKTQASLSASTGAGGTAASVQQQVLAGSAPDVVQMTFDTLNYAVNELGAKPLSTVFGEDAVAEALGGEYPMNESVVDFGTVDDVTYGIPYVLSTPVFFYNETALEAAGLPSDVDLSTWDSVADAAAAVTAQTGKPSLSISCTDPVGLWCMQSILRSNDGRVLSEDGSTIEFGDAAAVAAVQKLRDLFDQGVLQNADFAGQMESFSRGETVMHLDSSALQSSFSAAAAAGGWTLADSVMPGFEGETVVPTSSGSALYMFSDEPAEQAAAWKLIQFMTGAHAYEEISTKIGYLPLRSTLTEEGAPLGEWAASNTLLAPNLAQLDVLEPWVSYPGNNYVQVDTILADAVSNAVYFGADPEEAMTEAAARAQELIEK